jgi:hypothetical protein
VDRDWIDYVGLGLTLALIGVGVGGVIVAVLTLKDIQKQTRAAVRISVSAKRNTDALINSQRAWIVLRPDEKFHPAAGVFKLDWKIVNNGKSIARLIEANVLTAKPDITFTFPPYSYPSASIQLHRITLPPESPFDIWCHLLGPNGMEAADVDDIINRGRDLVAYGYVKYEDAFGKEHESRFCYYYAVPFGEFRVSLTAPEEYHRCT